MLYRSVLSKTTTPLLFTISKSPLRKLVPYLWARVDLVANMEKLRNHD